jgi:hypothetical protein
MSSNDIRLAESKIKSKNDFQIKSKQSQLISTNAQSNASSNKKNSTSTQVPQTLISPSINSKNTLPVVNVSKDTNKQPQKQPFTKLTQDQSTNRALTQFLNFMGTGITK